MQQCENTNWHDPFSEVVAIDFEASSLRAFSFPVEFGFCTSDLGDCAGYLIRPHDDWKDHVWDPESEKIQGISRERLMDEGICAREVAEIVIDVTRGRIPVCDGGEWDIRWMRTLFAAAGPGYDAPSLYCPHRVVQYAEFGVFPDEGCLLETEYNLWEPIKRDWTRFNAVDEPVRKHFSPNHRAAADAAFRMAHMRAQLDDEFLDYLIGTDALPVAGYFSIQERFAIRKRRAKALEMATREAARRGYVLHPRMASAKIDHPETD